MFGRVLNASLGFKESEPEGKDPCGMKMHDPYKSFTFDVLIIKKITTQYLLTLKQNYRMPRRQSRDGFFIAIQFYFSHYYITFIAVVTYSVCKYVIYVTKY